MLTAVLPEDADVDGGDDDDDDVVVVTSKMTVQGARSALHTAATGVTSAVDALEVVVAHDTNLASTALQGSEFVAEVASVEQSLVILRRNTHKLHGDWTQYHASMHASKPWTAFKDCRLPVGTPWGVGGAAGTKTTVDVVNPGMVDRCPGDRYDGGPQAPHHAEHTHHATFIVSSVRGDSKATVPFGSPRAAMLSTSAWLFRCCLDCYRHRGYCVLCAGCSGCTPLWMNKIEHLGL